MKKILIGLFTCLLVLSACGSKEDDSSNNDNNNNDNNEQKIDQLTDLLQFPKNGYDKSAPVAVMETSKGTITLVFFPEEAPKAVENFLTHSKNGYYNGVTFHRVIQEFMIQGGDPEGTGMGGESIWNQGFGVEASSKLFHFRGAISMAHSSQPNSNGSQFFIVQATSAQQIPATLSDLAKAKYQEIGGTPFLDGDYTVFGQTIEGMDVVDAIAAVEVDANDKPLEAVTIQSITVTTYGEWSASK